MQLSREGMIAAVGSAALSGLIAAAMGLMYGLESIVLVVLVVLSALGGAYFGYRSRAQ